jgi:probable phosphoglycerate mutase
MMLVDPGAIVECDARTQEAPICRHMGATEHIAARRRARPGDTPSFGESFSARVTTILLARHGETDWNAERRWQGHSDPPLNARGLAQARALAESLAERALAAVVSSDLARARQTAEVVGERLGLDVSLDPRLREVDVGEWSGLTSAEVETRFPEGFRRRLEGGTGWELGESYEAMGVRVMAALQAIAAAHEDGRVLVVTHGGPMRAVWAAAGGDLARGPRTSNCDVHEIAVWNGGIRRLDSAPDGGLHQQVQG